MTMSGCGLVVPAFVGCFSGIWGLQQSRVNRDERIAALLTCHRPHFMYKPINVESALQIVVDLVDLTHAETVVV